MLLNTEQGSQQHRGKNFQILQFFFKLKNLGSNFSRIYTTVCNNGLHDSQFGVFVEFGCFENFGVFGEFGRI